MSLGATEYGGEVGLVEMESKSWRKANGEPMRFFAKVSLWLPTKKSTKHRGPMLQFWETRPEGTLSSWIGWAPLSKAGEPIEFKTQGRRASYRARVINVPELLVKVDEAMQKQPSFKGLGASRAQVEAKLEEARGAINTFFTKLVHNKYGAREVDGRFSWDAKNIYFDYFGANAARRITVPLVQVHGWTNSLAPSRKDKNVAEGTEFPGAAHQFWNTTLWERAAWNTVNGFVVRLQNAIKYSSLAYARVITNYEYFYFLTAEAAGVSKLNSDEFFYIYTLDRFNTGTYYVEPMTYSDEQVRKYLTKEQYEYVLVARDYALSYGKRDQNAPLMGR